MKNSTFLIKAKFFLLSIACFLTLTANASPLCNQVFNEQADHASPDANFTFETIKDGLGNNVRLKITLDCPDPSVTEFHFREGFQLKEAFPNYLASNIAVSESGNYTTGTKELYVDFATPYPEDGATFSFVVQVGWYVNVGGTEYQPWDAYTRYHYTIGTDCSTTVHKMCDGLTVIGNNAASAAYLEAKSIGTAGSYTGVDLILHNYNASDPDGSTYWRNSLPALSVPGTWTKTTTNTTNDTFHYEFDTPQAGNTTFSLPQVEYRTAGNTNAYVNDASINFMFTLGAVCDVDDENPVLVTANPTKVGNYGFSIDLESTDNKNLALYTITGNDSNGNPFTVTADVNGTAHHDELYFELPEGIKITSSVSATVTVKDRSGNQDSKVVTLTPNMVAPTLNSVACYDATNTSITLKVDAISNNASSKVEKCHVTYGGNSKIVPLTVYNPSLSTITIDGLTKGTNYTFTVTAIGKYGEASTTTASASCSTTSNAEHCGVILANGGQPYVNIPHLNSRAIYWLTKSGTNELTLLVTHYPGTEEITGLYINSNGQNVNPAVPSMSWADGVVPINVDAHNGAATATSNLTADLFSVSNETVTFDGHPAQNAIKITFKYSEATTTFNQLYLRWHKPGKEYVTDGGGIIHFSTSDLGCDLSNLNALNVEWGENGNPAHFNPATNLANQDIDDTPIEGSCGDMIWGTSFSSSTTSTHNVIEDVDVENNIGFYTLKIGDAFPEGYSNGNFMDVGRSYTIVSDPKVLDEKLSERTDGTNRLIYNLGDSMDSPEQLFLLTLRNMEVGSKVTVTFDLEDLNPDCYVYDDGLTFNRVFHVGVGETSTAIYLAPNGKQTVRIEATATDKVASHFPVFMSTWQTRDCAAIAISNLRVYGCSAHTIETGNLVSTMSCEGSEVELTAVGYGTATTGFTWEESTDKISWTPISGTSNTNEVTPILDVTTYYRVTHGGIVSNIIEITGVVCCDDANSYEVYSEDFGTVGPWERKPYDGVQGHYFADYMVFCGNNTEADCGYSGCEYQWIPKTVADGIHAINVDGTIYQTCDEIQVAKTNGFIAPGADPYYVGHGYSKIEDGGYAVVSNSTYADDYTGWVHNKTDHTGNANGGFLLINVAGDALNPTETLILNKELTAPFCSGVRYNFSLWASQLAAPNQLPSSFKFKVIGYKGGTPSVLAEQNSHAMVDYQMEAWSNYGVTFEIPAAGVDRVMLEVWNVGVAGSGNDLVLDDIKVTTCSPNATLTSDYDTFDATNMSLSAVCTETVNVYTEITSGELSTFFPAGAKYMWLKKDGSNWTSVATTSVLSVETGAANNGIYKAIIANEVDVLNAVYNGGSLDTSVKSSCSIYAVTDEINITCESCESPTVSLTSDMNICSDVTTPVTLTANVTLTSGSSSVARYVWSKSTDGTNWTELVTNSVTTLTNTYEINPLPTETTHYKVMVVNGDKHEVCSAEETMTLTIVEKPVVTLGVVNNDELNCTLTRVTITANNVAGATYAWSAGATGAGSSATVTANNVYTVSVSQIAGCVGTASVSVSEDVNPPLLTLSPASPIINCSTLSTSVKLTAEAVDVTYAWSGDATTSSIRTVTSGGAYSVTVTSVGNGCTTSASVSVTENKEVPTVTISTPNIINCETTQITLSANATPAGSLDVNYKWSGTGDVTNTTLVSDGNVYVVTVTDNENFCTATASVQPTVDKVQPTVAGISSGIIDCEKTTQTITVTANGAHTLNYAWSAGVAGTASTGTTTDAGVYTVSITDGTNKCTVSASVSVSENKVNPTVTIPAVETLNCQVTETTLTANVSGATDISYAWSAGGSTTSTNNVADGTFVVTVTNNENKCTASAELVVSKDVASPTITISTPEELNCAVSVVTVSASATSTVAGHTYSYNWTGSKSGQTVEYNSPATYTVTVTDNVNHCTASEDVTINQDINNPDVEIPAVSQIDCENPSRVLTATVTAYNSHTVSYKWSQSETISTITVSVGGPYSVTVTDDVNKCSAVASVVVAQSSDLPTVTIPAVSDLNCQTTQTVLVVNVEGAANIKYEWNTGGSTTSTSNVTEGEYKVTVTNLDNNCSVVATQTVTKDVTIPVITLSSTTMLDCKVTNATMSVTASSTAGHSFKYSWSNGQEGAYAGFTANDDYSVIATDEVNKCTAVELFTIAKDINAPEVIMPTVPNITCIDANQTIIPTVNPYDSHNVEFSWTGGSTNTELTVSEGGAYYVTVTDTQNYCQTVASVSVVKDVEDPEIEISGIDNLTCSKTSVTVTISISNAANVSYDWGSGATTNSTKEFTSGEVVTLVVINTDNSCISSATISINQNTEKPNISIPTPKEITCVVTDVDLLVNVSGSGNYEYAWSNLQTSSTTTVDSEGDYMVTVTNVSNDCEATASVTVNKSVTTPDVTPKEAVVVLTCSDKSALIGVTSSVANVEFLWNTNEKLADITISDGGDYTVTVTDKSNGCSASATINVQDEGVEPQISINQLNKVVVTLGESLDLEALVAAGSKMNVEWINSENVQLIFGTDLEVGDDLTTTVQPYKDLKFIAKAENGCGVDEKEFEVEVKWPTAITPHFPDGFNDDFVTGMSIELYIYSRYGHLVSHTTDGWDGTWSEGMHKGQIADPGVYYYVAKLPDGSTKKGTVEIVKYEK